MSLVSIEKPTENKFIPIYYQIANFLHRKIKQRELKPGGKPPNEINLAKTFDISRVTLRQSLSLLEGDDLLVREHRNGLGRGRRNRTSIKKPINKKTEQSHWNHLGGRLQP